MTVLLTTASIGTLVLLVINGAALAYLVAIRAKSAATWWLIGRTVAAVVYWGGSLHATTVIAPAVWVQSVLLDAALLAMGVAFVQFAYAFLEPARPREARAVLGGTAALWAALVAVSVANVATDEGLVSDLGLYTAATTLGAVLYALAAVVLVRKWRAARGTREGRAYAAFIGVLALLVAAVAVEAVLITDQGLASPAPLYLRAVHTLLLVVVYVQFAPEPTTFQVKLVGFSLATVLLILFATAVVAIEDGDTYADEEVLVAGRAVAVEPTASGGYRAVPVGGPATAPAPEGRRLALGDDDAERVALPFPFPFYGRTYEAVWVGSNGALSFAPPPADVPFDEELAALPGRPAVAVAYTDLDPTAGGSVSVRADSAALVVVWAGVPVFGTGGEATVTARAELRPDGRVLLAYGDVDGFPAVGVVPGDRPPRRSARELGVAPVAAAAGAPLLAWAELGVHERLVPMAWLVLGAAAFVVGVFPLFFHLSLVRPLHRLLGGVRRVNDGDLAATVPVGARDEIGLLADNFNRMTDSLRAYADRMEELVRERTATLEASLRELRETQDRLVQQEKLASLGQLTAGIAHEIKNPLNFVTNFAGLSVELAGDLRAALAAGDAAEAEALLGDLAQNAERIAEHGARADAIVHGMMRHARRSDAAPTRVALNALVAEHAELAWHGLRARDPALAVEVATTLDPSVGAVEVRPADLGRAVVNLVTNAVEAVRDRTRTDGPARVTVHTRAAGACVAVVVEDTGDGLAPAAAARLFEPFYTTKPTGAGNTGLGLSIAHDVAVAHGGTLEATSGPDGAVFTLALPAPPTA